jgi:lipoate-protein ligase A
MLCIRLENNDPFFCLAAEEYLLKNFSEDFFMLWQSVDCVVVGKHQNLLAEINYPFCIKNNITLARRISGGGTVSHDSGNINFFTSETFQTRAKSTSNSLLEPVTASISQKKE